MLPTITATGNLAADPDLRFTASGKACANLRIGCNKNRKNDAGEWETTATVWLGVTLWGAEAERAVEHYKKGDEVTVTGHLITREYDRQDGTKGTAIEVDYPTVSLPRIREDRQQQQTTQPAGAPPTSAWGTPATPPEQPAAPAPAQPATTAPDLWGQTNPGAQAPPF